MGKSINICENKVDGDKKALKEKSNQNIIESIREAGTGKMTLNLSKVSHLRPHILNEDLYKLAHEGVS